MTDGIRLARPQDAAAISRVIAAALRETNARDYSAAVIGRLVHTFSPAAVSAALAHRTVFVAGRGAAILGTASLEGDEVRAVFVDPAWQGGGIGRALMAEVIRTAARRGIDSLALRSSLTAVPFYTRLGFRPVREHVHGDERTIVMHRRPGGRADR